MKNFVLDASIALAWCFSDEATPVTQALLERLEVATAFVPSLWSLELANVLLGAERKQRITYAQVTEFLSLLGNLRIEVDLETGARGFHDILLLAHAEHLTSYDAAYLELAMRLGLPLATKDVSLSKAASRLGVPLLG